MTHGDDLEQRLMEAVGDGDFAAFESLYERFHGLVYAIAIRIVGDDDAAQDVVQSVFLGIWRAPQRFRGGALRRWIAVVARNRAVDIVRGRRAEPPLTDGAAPLPAAEDLEGEVMVRIDGQLARRAMEALPSDQRRSIELAFFGGLTHAEIASTTATPLGTVKTRIRTGLRALRTALAVERVS